MIRPQWIACIAAAGLLGAAPSPASQTPETPPGEGVICAWAIYSVLDEVGRRCTSNASPEMKAEIRHAVEALDAYVMTNAALTADQVHQFKVQQGGAETPDAMLCGGDALGMLEHTQANVSPAELRASVDALVARPGEPTWGTCL